MDPNLPQENSPSYFGGSGLDPNRMTLGRRFKMLWEGFQYYARQVWPYVYQLVNFLVYEIIKVLRGIVKMGLQQFGMFKE